MIRHEQLNILGKHYKVIHTKELSETGNKSDEVTGLHIPYPRTLKIWSGLDRYDYLELLIHETTHAIDQILDINMSERAVSLLSTGQADFFMRNGIIKP